MRCCHNMSPESLRRFSGIKGCTAFTRWERCSLFRTKTQYLKPSCRDITGKPTCVVKELIMSPPIRRTITGRRINRFITIGLICVLLTALVLPSYKWIVQAMMMSCNYAGTDNEGTYFWTCAYYDDGSDGWPYYGGGGDSIDSKMAKIDSAVVYQRVILQLW